MQAIESPDIHYLSAAVGWLELGNPTEAEAELRRIQPGLQEHEAVLDAWWMLHAARKDWSAGLAIARRLVMVLPDAVQGWLHLSYALRRAPEGGLAAAWETLLPVYERFPNEPTVSYNLACYACQLGKLDEARVWFKKACLTGGEKQMTEMAIHDPDLEPLWPELKKPEKH